MRVHFLMLGHVSYAVVPERFERLVLESEGELILLAPGTPTPEFKRGHSLAFSPTQDVAIFRGDHTKEFLSVSSRSGPNEAPEFLPTSASGNGRQVTLQSSSFESSTLSHIAALFECEPTSQSLTLQSRAARLTLSHSYDAPAFAEMLDGGPGPVSLGIFCKGLDTVCRKRPGSVSDAWVDVLTTPHGRFRIAMLRAGRVWIELLERLERHDR